MEKSRRPRRAPGACRVLAWAVLLLSAHSVPAVLPAQEPADPRSRELREILARSGRSGAR